MSTLALHPARPLAGLVGGMAFGAALLILGEPSAALLTAAGDHGAVLVVIGAVHDRSLADRLLGTVASEVMKRADCDVLVVRPDRR